jgi:hypothetical protein
MRIEVWATNSTLAQRLLKREDVTRLLKVSVNKHIKNYKSKSDFMVPFNPGQRVNFITPTPKGPFFVTLLISAFPSAGIKPYHGWGEIDGLRFNFDTTDAYHEVLVPIGYAPIQKPPQEKKKPRRRR